MAGRGKGPRRGWCATVRRTFVAGLVVLAIAGLVALRGGVSTAAPQVAAPYHPPSFHCSFHHFANGEAPVLGKYPDDPLCVDYDKRDITASNGGALRFLLAEPSRFAIAVPKCRYWQTDHWSVQLAPADGALIRWDGSYWFDKGRGVGAVLTRNFSIGGQAVGAWQVAQAVATVSPQLASQIRSYGAGRGGGGGASFSLPAGYRSCPR